MKNREDKNYSTTSQKSRIKIHPSYKKSINFNSNKNNNNKSKQQSMKESSRKSTNSKNKTKLSNLETKNYKIHSSNTSLKPLSTFNTTSTKPTSKDQTPPISTNHRYLTPSNHLQESGLNPKNIRLPQKKILKKVSVETNASVVLRLSVLSRNYNKLTTNWLSYCIKNAWVIAMVDFIVYY